MVKHFSQVWFHTLVNGFKSIEYFFGCFVRHKTFICAHKFKESRYIPSKGGRLFTLSMRPRIRATSFNPV